jgi:lipoprotein-anchoring transpeptidase ErfK/SrfK
MKAAVLVLVVAAGLITQVGTANTAVFYLRSLQLEQSWRLAEAAGVPGARLESPRAALRSLDVRWVGAVPYATISGAALRDPFTEPEAQANRAHAEARSMAQGRALAALDRLRTASGPFQQTYYDGLVALGRAREPVEFDRLSAGWEEETARTQSARDQLATASGGFSDGLPKDVVEGMAALKALAESASRSGISSDPAWQTSVDVQLYLARPYPALLQGHAGVAQELNGALSVVGKRVNARKTVESDLEQIPKLLPRALRYGIGDEYSNQADELKKSFTVARGDDDLVKVADTAEALVKDLDSANQGRLPVTGIACIPNAPEKQITIHLKTQQLVAYQHGCPYLRTPVTTGRPALPTGRGTFHIFYKSRSYHMVSPWPDGSPFHYPPTWVYNAMEFIGDGTFIHNADWQPDASYGPGSQNGPYASHGCVHVVDAPLAQLYDWAPIGTTVIVGD